MWLLFPWLKPTDDHEILGVVTGTHTEFAQILVQISSSRQNFCYG